MKVLVPFGTRPEIVKLAPVVTALRSGGADVHTIATGQHYDAALTDAFFTELRLVPDERWVLPTTDAARAGALMTHAYARIAELTPDVVVVLGDTNTVPTFAVAARHNRVPVVHIEAGLRSFNDTSLEEVNRRIVGSIASLHFAPTELAARMLRLEGVASERIHVVGNPVCDALRACGALPRPWRDRHGVVVTAHRATNVDDPQRLSALCDIVAGLARDHGAVTFPVHPRTRARLESSGLSARLADPRISLLPPLPYGEMLERIAAARVVVTDSGGIQEEAAWFRVPAVVLRQSTPRWEGVLAGMAVLTGLDENEALSQARRLAAPDEQRRIGAIACPYGDGHSAPRIAAALLDQSATEHLRLREPERCLPDVLV